MAIAWDLVIGAIVGLICTLVLFRRIRNENGKNNFIVLVISGFSTGFAIYMGIVSIIFAISGNIPFDQTNIVSQKVIAFFGGLTLIAVSFYYLFINRKIS